jgi:thiol:disulfide interchange protein DsbC
MNYPKPVALAALVLGLVFHSTTIAESDEGQIARAIAERFPGSTPEYIAPSPIPGFYEVSLGGELIYVSSDAQFAFIGRLFDLESRADLSEPVVAKIRLKTIDEVPENKMIIFEPMGPTKHTITTFTDVDCPYCRKMHKEIDQLLEAGVRVRYLLYPRTAIGSPSYLKAVSVWCSRDRNEALTRAKLGETPEARDCPNPVAEHIQFAGRLGLTGTPMTITDSGERLLGYLPADRLVARLEASTQAKIPVTERRDQ